MRSSWKWLAVAGIVVLITASALKIRPAPQQGLMAKAKRVTSTAGWYRRDDLQYNPYQWLSERSILVLQVDAAGRQSATQVETETGSEKPLTDFNAWFSRRKNALPFWKLSPDHKSVLWADHVLPMTWRVAALNGSNSLAWSQPKAPVDWDMVTADWSCDSRSWGEMQGMSLTLHSVIRPRVTRTTRVFEPPNVTTEFLCGFNRKGEGIVAVDGPGPRFYRFTSGSSTASGSLLPSSTNSESASRVEDIELAPGGEKVAWICSTMISTPDSLQWVPGCCGHACGIAR